MPSAKRPPIGSASLNRAVDRHVNAQERLDESAEAPKSGNAEIFSRAFKQAHWMKRGYAFPAWVPDQVEEVAIHFKRKYPNRRIAREDIMTLAWQAFYAQFRENAESLLDPSVFPRKNEKENIPDGFDFE